MYVIITHLGGGYPNGYATTYRTSLFARGLISAGGRVLLLCPGPSENSATGIFNREVKGVKDGVEFEYSCGTTIRGKTFLRQKWLVLKGLLLSARRIRLAHRSEKVDAIVVFSNKWEALLIYWLTARLCKARFVDERSERPFYQAEHSPLWMAVSYLHTYTLFRLFDGAIVVSDYLMEYMRKRVRPRAGLLKVPIMVDVSQFSSVIVPAPIPGRYVAFCGSWVESQNGMHSLMKAFAEIHEEFPDLKLVLIGDTEKVSAIPAYRSYAEELAISDQVIFTGFLPRSELIPYLNHASMLVLARPLTRQSEAGFPTKLGEYLATGKPVLVTRTGEIATYLKDRYDVFLVPPDDIKSFAEGMRYILTHEQESTEVGLRGRDTAIRCFDYIENGARVKAFIDHLGQRNSVRS